MTSRFIMMFHLLAMLMLFVPAINGIAVMSVDLGSEWMKIAIVSPGVPMEIVLNKESKRKTPATIALRPDERTFGEDAVNIGVRFPKASYSYLLDLLGKKIDNPVVKLFHQRFPYYDIVEDPERGTVLFRHDDNTLYSVEQLLAMILKKAEEFAEISANQRVMEAVLTVPGFFNQAERRAMLQVAELAGVKVLQLINDYTAVAINYGIFRRKDFNESAQYIMFYDMGASSTTATVVSYQIVKTKDKGLTETNPQLAILGVGYDRTLGGLEMQLRLRDFLGQKFNEQKRTPNDVFKNPRALAKLFKEAGRLKNVLSANLEHHAQVEGLLDDKDFKLLVTREMFEGMLEDLFDRVAAPVEQAMKSSGLDLSVISQVILVGAGTRVPKVQESLSKIVKMELGKSINTDEAACMGAVYKAADLSTGFKVKKFLTKDAVIFPIQVLFERESEGSSSPRLVKRTLFGPMNPYFQKKVLTFNRHQNDFGFTVSYGELDHLPPKEIEMLGPQELSTVELTGVGSALSKHTGPNVDSKGVKTHFTMDDSGVLSLSGVELVLEKTLTDEELAAQDESPLSKLGSTISKLFTRADDKKDDVKEESKPEKLPGDEEDKEKKEEKETEDKSENVKKTETNEEKKSEKEETKNTTKVGEKKNKIVVIKETINSLEKRQGVEELTGQSFQQSVELINELNENDRERNRREQALNGLESFVFDTQGKLETTEYTAAADDDEIGKILQACSQTLDWLYDDGSDLDALTYENKLEELQGLTRQLFGRVKEHQDRPEAVRTLRSMLNSSRHFLIKARNMSASEVMDDNFTEVELGSLEKLIDETVEWLTQKEKEQTTLKPSNSPKLTVKSIAEKFAALDREVKYLVNKARLWKPKKSKEESKDEPKKKGTSANETEADEVTVEEDKNQEGEPDEALNENSDEKLTGQTTDNVEAQDKPQEESVEDKLRELESVVEEFSENAVEKEDEGQKEEASDEEQEDLQSHTEL